MAGLPRLADHSDQHQQLLQARCADLADGGGCGETTELHPFRCPADAPLRKLTVDLIKTYRKINDVSRVCVAWGQVCMLWYVCGRVCIVKVVLMKVWYTHILYICTYNNYIHTYIHTWRGSP